MPTGVFKRPSVEERFWKYVRKTEGCWEWTGARHKQGYGLFQSAEKLVSAHRFSHELHKGEIAEGLFVLHSCDNPPCVNPRHLSVGTQKSNLDDMTKRGRDRRSGEKHGMAKLTWKKVAEIRKLHSTGKYLRKDIATMFSITPTNVGYVTRKQTWYNKDNY